MFFLFSCIDTQRIVLQLLNVALNLSIIINYIAEPHLILKKTSSLIAFFVSFSFLLLTSITLETPDKTFTILEIDLVSLKKQLTKNSAMNGIIMFM